LSLKVSGLSKVRTKGAGNDVRNVRLWRGLLGVDKRTVIEDIEFSEEGVDGVDLVVARVRPRGGVLRRCGRCQRKAPWYDRGEGGAGGGAWIYRTALNATRTVLHHMDGQVSAAVHNTAHLRWSWRRHFASVPTQVADSLVAYPDTAPRAPAPARPCWASPAASGTSPGSSPHTTGR
jgi:hypothetical protein